MTPSSFILHPSSLQYRTFQRQDLARAALHDGLIAALDTGLGKTIFGFTFALLKVGWTVVPKTGDQPARLRPNAPVLFLAPGDLHAQIIAEAWDKLRLRLVRLDSLATFDKLCADDAGQPRLDAEGRPLLPPDFYLTSYTELCTNGVTRIPDPLDHDNPRHLLTWACLPELAPGDTTRDPDDDGRKLLRGQEAFRSVRHVFTWRDRVWREEFDLLQVHPDDTRKDLDTAYAREIEKLDHLEDVKLAANLRLKLDRAYTRLQNLFTHRPCPQYSELTLTQQDFVIREFLRRAFDSYREGEGETREFPLGPLPPGYVVGQPETDTRPKWRIKCVYAPALVDQAYRAFDCAVVDEGVKMKGEDTYVGKGVRALEAAFRCVLTATPVKNRLPDIFRLAWWATGGRTEAHARFPYRDDASERSQFAQTFMVSERNLTKEAKAEEAARANRKLHGPLGGSAKPKKANPRYTKLTAEICNIHRLWKLLAAVVLRRRKDECGEDIVPRVRKVIRVKLGTLQRQVVRYHLNAAYLDCNGQKAIGPQLTSLRIAATDPTTTCLPNKGQVVLPCDCLDKQGRARPGCPDCGGRGQMHPPHVSGNPYTPKFAAVLTVVKEILERRESVLIGTTFNEAHDHLGRLLREAGVPYVLADGRVNPNQRGPLLQRFRAGSVPVCLGGVESVANGHNLDTINNVIIYSYSWAYDLIKQFLDRVHRLTSRKPVNVYVVFCDGTIDQRLESLNGEKTDSVELALDGRLIGERSEEVNLAELLEIARQEFDAARDTVDEAAIQREWPLLRTQLGAAFAGWQSAHPEIRNQKSEIGNQTVVATARLAGTTESSVLSVPSCSRPLAADWRQQMRDLARKLRHSVGPDLWSQL